MVEWGVTEIDTEMTEDFGTARIEKQRKDLLEALKTSRGTIMETRTRTDLAAMV